MEKIIDIDKHQVKGSLEHSKEYPWNNLFGYSSKQIHSLLLKELSKPVGSILNTEWIKELITQTNPNAVDEKKDKLPLIVACQNKHFDAIKILLEHDKTNSNATDLYGWNALMFVSVGTEYHLDLFRFLLSFPKINPNMKNDEGATTLHAASYRNREWSVLELLNHPEIDTNIQDNRGRTALHLVATYKNNFTKVIINHPKTNPNIQDNSGETPLMIASAEGNSQVVMELLKHPNIDIRLKDKLNQTAWDLAKPKIQRKFPQLNPEKI